MRILILNFYCDGDKQVADIAGVKVCTVRSHLDNVSRKFDINGFKAMFRFALANDCLHEGHYKGEYLFDGYDKVPWPKPPSQNGKEG